MSLARAWVRCCLAGLVFLVPTMGSAAEVSATVLLYRDFEGVGQPYLTRFLITPDYTRIDYGKDGDDFVLIERDLGVLNNVTHEAKRVMTLDEQTVTIPTPVPLKISGKSQPVGDMPEIGGKPTVHNVLEVNGKTCVNVVAAQGLLPDAVSAMAQFRRILAGQQAETLAAIPADMTDDCEMAQHIFHPEKVTSFGLPIRVWDAQGRKRELLDLKVNQSVDGRLFMIPEGYSSYRISDSGR